MSGNDPYADLAQAILYWDWARREGTRAKQIEAERRLKHLASLLEEAGWSIGRKKP